MRGRSLPGYVTDPFTDLLFNALLGFSFLFLVSVMFINPVAKMGNAILKAEYIITATWPDDRQDDIDLWVEDPDGNIVSYLVKDAGWLHLDRDDRGDLNDTIEVNGQPIVHPVNQEIVTLRGIIAGEYTVNLYFYDDRAKQPVEVTVKLERVNPEFALRYVGQVTLTAQDEEKTALRFQLAADGELDEINQRQKKLTPYALEPPA